MEKNYLTIQLFQLFTHMEFTDEKKKQIEKDIVEMVIAALENNAIKESDMAVIGQMVLERIDKIENQADLILFLEILAERWSIFSPLVTREKGAVEHTADEKKAGQVEAMIKDGNIDEALTLVKSATEV